MTNLNSGIAFPASQKENVPKIRFCLNTATIRGQKLNLVEAIDLTAKAGYDAIEPWMGEIDRYISQGGRLKDLKKRLEDRQLACPSAIGFAQWISNDSKVRKQALEQAKREMDRVRQIGGTRIAAPPAGGTSSKIDLEQVAERYRELLKVGDATGVVPELEIWGFSQTLTRLSQVVHVILETDHPKACILPDVYHLYKGGSGFDGFRYLNCSAIPVFHWNDYPARPLRKDIGDAHRLYPGDGIAPLSTLLKQLLSNGFSGWLSLELFNRKYWKQDALTVAKTGLKKCNILHKVE